MSAGFIYNTIVYLTQTYSNYQPNVQNMVIIALCMNYFSHELVTNLCKFFIHSTKKKSIERLLSNETISCRCYTPYVTSYES